MTHSDHWTPTTSVPSPAGTRVPGMDKVVSSAAAALEDVRDGASLAVGGFGLCGIPSVLIAEPAHPGGA